MQDYNQFIDACNKNNIDTSAPQSLEGIPFKLCTAKLPDDIIDLPCEEKFPLDPYESKNTGISIESVEEMLKIIQYKSILLATNPQKPKPKNITSHYKDLFAFGTPEEYVQFKREYSTYLKFQSEELGYEIKPCKDPLCVNHAIPTYDYCLTHLQLDPNFKDDIFVHQCAISEDGAKCQNVCSTKLNKCAYHRRAVKKK